MVWALVFICVDLLGLVFMYWVRFYLVLEGFEFELVEIEVVV